MKLTLPIMLAAMGFAAAGCGASASSNGAGGTGSVAGTVATLPTSTSTTASGGASFNAKLGNVRQQLKQGLNGIEHGSLTSAATVLMTCQSTVTSKLGSRASTASQQQAVSYLRTACDDVAKAEAKLRKGDTSSAKTLAKDALQQVKQSEQAAR